MTTHAEQRCLNRRRLPNLYLDIDLSSVVVVYYNHSPVTAPQADPTEMNGEYLVPAHFPKLVPLTKAHSGNSLSAESGKGGYLVAWGLVAAWIGVGYHPHTTRLVPPARPAQNRLVVCCCRRCKGYWWRGRALQSSPVEGGLLPLWVQFVRSVPLRRQVGQLPHWLKRLAPWRACDPE